MFVLWHQKFKMKYNSVGFLINKGPLFVDCK